MSKTEKRGRPTKYKEKYAEDLVKYFQFKEETYTEEVASQGKAIEVKKTRLDFPTIEGFCSSIGVSKQCFHEWVPKHELFGDAYRIAKQNQKHILIKGGLNGEFNSGFAKFVAINCTDMVDRTEMKTENEHKHEGYGLAFDLSRKPE